MKDISTIYELICNAQKYYGQKPAFTYLEGQNEITISYDDFASHVICTAKLL